MKPLGGHRVLDLGWYAPGPFCSLLCATLGAEVIKIEPPSGDPLRALDPEAFGRLNAGKKSVRLDLKQQEGRESFLALARAADFVIEGLRPGVVERLGVSFDDVRSVAPRVVYVSIVGYDRRGPRRDRAGHDVNYMALAGAIYGVSAPLPLQVADFAAGGLYAVAGILAALIERARTGEGRRLDLSMHEGLLAMNRLGSGVVAERLSGRYPCYAIYKTRDGEALSVGALEPEFWRRFCVALGREDWIDRAWDEEAREEVAGLVVKRDLADWEALFEDVDACVEPVRPPGQVRVASSPWPFGDAISVGTAPVPELGEHTEALLLQAGLAPAAVAALRARGVC